MPAESYSWANHPTPSPHIARPPESTSSVAICLASTAGRWRNAGDTEHAETDPLGHRRQPRQRRVRLGYVGPGRADLRDLTKMVHHPDVLDAGRLGVRGDCAQMRSQLVASTGPIEARQVQPDADAGLRFRSGRRRAGTTDRRGVANDAGTTTTGSGVMKIRPRLGDNLGVNRRPTTQLISDDVGSHRHGASGIAPPAFGSRHVEHNGDARHAGRQLPTPSRQHATRCRDRGNRSLSSAVDAGDWQRSDRALRTRLSRRAGRARSRRQRRARHRWTRSDSPRSVQRPTTTFPRRPDRSAQRGRAPECVGVSRRARRSAQVIAQGCAGSGRNELATINFGTKYVVAQPESDTANGVDETQLWCLQLQLAAQVRQVNVDHVSVADPVRAPHFFE